jgi:phage tail-like protein
MARKNEQSVEPAPTLKRRALLGGAAVGGAALAATMLDSIWPDTAAAAPSPADDSIPDPIFALDFGDGPTSFFKSMDGLSSETEVVEFRNGGEPNAPARKRPGRVKYGDITLKRGYTATDDLWQWRKLVEDNKMDLARKNGAILLLDRSGRVRARYNFYEGWPCKWYVPELDSDSSAMVFEAITLAVEKIERAFKFS